MRTAPVAMTVLLLACAAAAGGCEGVGLFGQAFKPKEKALYPIADRPTLVLVDDPTNALSDPSLNALMAANVGYHLQRERRVTQLVPPESVYPMASELGKEFATMPVDEVGRRVGAEQVISVLIEGAQIHSQPGVIRPMIAVRVKLIDARSGRRLFPAAGGADVADPLRSTRGHPVATQLFYRYGTDPNRGEVMQAVRRLAAKAGRDVARLFHDYREREPGQRFDE